MLKLRKGSLVLSVVALIALAAPTASAWWFVFPWHPPRAHPRSPVTASYDAAVAKSWGDLLNTVIRDEKIAPPPASRIMGYWGVALYESVVAGMPEHRSLGRQLNGLPRMPHPLVGSQYHWPTVANAASARVLRGLLPTATAPSLAAIDALEAGNTPATTDVSARVQRNSVLLGRHLADRVLAWASRDGYAELNACEYTVPVGEGLWEPTPPAFQANPLQPCWGQLRPFVLQTGDELLPDAHPPFSTDPSSPFFAAAQEVYDVSNALTEEQKEIAFFWADGAGTATPAGHWMSLVGQLSAEHEWTLALAAEAYARVGISVADAFICCWSAKFSTNLLRPVTFIQAHIDPDWQSLIPTPPFPTYTSGHSTQSGASSTVLTDLLGDVAFTDHTHDGRGLAPRSFASFTEAAEEAAVSRLYGGIHFTFDNDGGLALGRAAAAKILENVRFRR